MYCVMYELKGLSAPEGAIGHYHGVKLYTRRQTSQKKKQRNELTGQSPPRTIVLYKPQDIIYWRQGLSISNS